MSLSTHPRPIPIDYSAADQTLAEPSAGLYISTAGDLVVRLRGGATAALTGLQAGRVYDFTIVKIAKAGSTAAGLVLLWLP
jgi:hypothetical protein